MKVTVISERNEKDTKIKEEIIYRDIKYMEISIINNNWVLTTKSGNRILLPIKTHTIEYIEE